MQLQCPNVTNTINKHKILDEEENKTYANMMLALLQ